MRNAFAFGALNMSRDAWRDGDGFATTAHRGDALICDVLT
jgi:hypothetical protein